MLERRSDHFLAFSIAALIASVIGVQLGRDAIGEINPVHFRGPAARPLGITPIEPAPPADAFAQAEVWSQNYAPPRFDCGRECDSYQARRAAAQAIDTEAAPARDRYWREATPAAEPAAWAPGETGPAALSVDRYMHYPVEEASAVEEKPVAAEVEPVVE